jgi:HSP20 family protein
MLPVKTSLLPTVSRFFDDDWNKLFDWSGENFMLNQSTLPAVNIQENADSLIVEMAAPGLKKEDFQIELHKHTLRISRHISKEVERQNDYRRLEFNYGSFERSFNLNYKVLDDSKISASYSDGILKIVIGKKEEAKEKPARIIKIS